MVKMTREQFNERFIHKGGVETLDSFVLDELYTTEYIGKHFGVNRNLIGEWIRDIYGKNYNLRKKRKEKVIEEMLNFARKHSEEEFREAYYYISKHYYEVALEEAYVRGIYEEK